ncbi:MAG TPA: DEAD/DEAH box helicase [Methanospirillum sp.]|nr:DEAD/DEAH box helicase [Methanospirillum sp.]
MIILHAVYDIHSPEYLLFFGEACHEPHYEQAPPRRGRRPKIPPPDFHPFGASPDDMIPLIQTLAGCTREELVTGTRSVRLPTIDILPVGSPQWQQETQKSPDGQVVLIAWQVPVIGVPLSFVRQITGNSGQITGVSGIGPSVRYWVEICRFTLDLLIRERFTPAAHIQDAAFGIISWEPYYAPEDLMFMSSLAGAMPALCRTSIAAPRGKARKEPEPGDIISTFISSLMRQSIREALLNDPIRIRPSEKMKTIEGSYLACYYHLAAPDRDEEKDHLPVPDQTTLSRLSAWLNRPHISSTLDDLNLCLRLSEPETEGDAWEISFLLRSRNDPSLLIPASMIWKKRSEFYTSLPSPDIMEEALLTGLGKVVKYCRFLVPAIQQRRPSGARLDHHDVWTFLSHDAPLLAGAGVDVLLPHWWMEGKVRPVIRMQVQLPEGMGKSHIGLDTLLSFDYQIALGDDVISPEEFFEKADLKGSLMKIQGRWVAFDVSDVQKNLQKFKNQFENGEISASDMMRAYATGRLGDEMDVMVEAADEWCSTIVDAVKNGPVPGKRPVPKAFSGLLRPYQEVGHSFLVSCADIGIGACLADDMGLGKTPQTIAYLLTRKASGKTDPSLLICPTSVVGNWEREVLRFGPSLKVHVHHGTDRMKDEAFSKATRSHDLVITTYALAARDVSLIRNQSWSSLILDEAQNIKNPLTKQAKAIQSIKGGHRIALTGTPVENRLSELWSIMHFLNPGYLGSSGHFQEMYANPIERSQDAGRAEELRRLVRPFLLRRLKTDRTIISDLPEKMEYKIYCTLTREQATLYQAVVNGIAESMEHLDGIARRGAILAVLTRLKQICDHPVLYVTDAKNDPARSGKVQRLMEMLEEVRDEGDAAIIFTQYATFATRLQEMIEKKFSDPVLLLTGSTPRKRREELIKRFMEPGGPQIFVISLKAGGTGLNLTRANHVFHIDRWWNPAVEDQATDRTFRIGQTRDVQVHLMIAAGTLEERIDTIIMDKRSIANQVLGTGEDWLTGMSTDELLDIVTLRDSVFEED